MAVPPPPGYRVGKVEYFGVKLGKGYGKHAAQVLHPNSQGAPFNLSAGVSPFAEQSHFFPPFSLLKPPSWS